MSGVRPSAEPTLPIVAVVVVMSVMAAVTFASPMIAPRPFVAATVEVSV